MVEQLDRDFRTIVEAIFGLSQLGTQSGEFKINQGTFDAWRMWIRANGRRRLGRLRVVAGGAGAVSDTADPFVSADWTELVNGDLPDDSSIWDCYILNAGLEVSSSGVFTGGIVGLRTNTGAGGALTIGELGTSINVFAPLVSSSMPILYDPDLHASILFVATVSAAADLDFLAELLYVRRGALPPTI